MFDISTVSKRYFTVKINNTVIDVEPPKVKVLKKIINLSKSGNEETLDDLAEAVRMIFSKNKNNYKVSEDLIDELDIDQMGEILTEYFDWLNKTKNSKN